MQEDIHSSSPCCKQHWGPRRGLRPHPPNHLPPPALHSLQDLILVLNLDHHLPKQLGLLLTAKATKQLLETRS